MFACLSLGFLIFITVLHCSAARLFFYLMLLLTVHSSGSNNKMNDFLWLVYVLYQKVTPQPKPPIERIG